MLRACRRRLRPGSTRTRGGGCAGSWCPRERPDACPPSQRSACVLPELALSLLHGGDQHVPHGSPPTPERCRCSEPVSGHAAPLENVICSYGRPCLVSCRRAVLKLSGRELAITRTRPPSRTAVLVAACDTPTPAPQCSLGPGDPPPCLPAPLSCTSWSAEVPPRPGPAPCASATTSPV